jgi:hypothetical protein
MAVPAISLDALRAGDPSALSALFETFADRISWPLGERCEPAAAEDIVQRPSSPPSRT